MKMNRRVEKKKKLKELLVCKSWWRGKKIFSKQQHKCISSRIELFRRTFSFFLFFFFGQSAYPLLPPSFILFSFSHWFFRWCDFRAFWARKNLPQLSQLFHSNGCKFRYFRFQRMARCIFLTTTDLLEVFEVWTTELPPPLSFHNSRISTRQEQARYSVEQEWGYSCDTFER